MITTDTFNAFGRRIASTVGCPYVAIAATPNPIRQLEHDALRARAEQMYQSVVDGLTLPPAEIEKRTAHLVKQLNPQGVPRSSVPV